MHFAFTLGRIALIAGFIVSGAYKLTDIAGTAAQIQSKLIIPPALNDMTVQIEAMVGMTIWQILAILAALVQVAGGVLIAFNVLTRATAVVLLIYTAVGTFLIHDFWNMPAGADRMKSMFDALTNLSIIGAFLMLASWRRPVAYAEVPVDDWPRAFNR